MRSRWLALVVLALMAGAPASAQVLDLLEAPWAAVDDTSGTGGADLAWERGLGGESRWRTDRLSLTIRVPVGQRAVAYVRGSYVRLDVGDQPVLDRWPESVSDETTIDVGQWPGESHIEDFGQPEVGMVLPLKLPALGPGHLALQMTPPFGKDETFPLSSRALVLRVDWRRYEFAVGPVSFGGRVGWEVSRDASGDVFNEDAFPDGPRFAVGLGTPLSAPRGLTLGWAARELSGGHHSRRAELAAWTTTGGGDRVRLRLVRELGDTQHRMTDWRVGVAFELRRPELEESD